MNRPYKKISPLNLDNRDLEGFCETFTRTAQARFCKDALAVGFRICALDFRLCTLQFILRPERLCERFFMGRSQTLTSIRKTIVGAQGFKIFAVTSRASTL